MKQKYQVFECLQNYFTDISPQLQDIIIKRIGSKKYTYNPGDVINNIYFILEGDVQLGFITKSAIIPAGNIVGEFQLFNQLSRRASSFKACTKASIAILPLSYFNKIKSQKLENYKFISVNLQTQNQQLRYIFSKCFQHQYKLRGDQIAIQHEDNQNDFVMIKSGIFLIKKYIGIGVVQKYKIQIEKQFALTQVGQGQIISENLTCDSSKGQIFFGKNYYVKCMLEQYGQLNTLLYSSHSMKQSHLQIQKSIKKLCVPHSQLVNSILPPVFQSPKKSKSVDKDSKLKKVIKTQSLQKQKNIYQKNHYEINRCNNNLLQSSQTNSNLSLIPLIKLRRPSMPEQIKSPKQKILQKYFKSRLQKPQSLRISTQKKQGIQQKDEEIPQIFTSRFQKKMFLKPGNPFRHFKSKSISLQEFIVNQKYSTKISQSMLLKPKPIKSYLKIINSK